MKVLCLIISFSFFYFTSTLAAIKCPKSIQSKVLIGKVGEPSKFYTPVKNKCDDETLNMFTNCIENKAKDRLYFGHINRSENIKKSRCPYGYAPKVANGYLAYQKYKNEKVCLDPCSSISVGKFFRDTEKFGPTRALNIGDVVFVPELKGHKCGQTKHSGCAVVTQFIEYTNKPVLDVFSGTCKKIFRGQCLDFKDDKLPSQVKLYKLKPKPAQRFKKAHEFPSVSAKKLKAIRNSSTRKF